MNSAPIEFHKIWIDQCLATEGIRERFGLDDALNYLIGEKLFSFLHAAERDPLFAAEVPDFIREIRRLFTSEEIRDYLDRLENTKYLAPPDPDLEMDELDKTQTRSPARKPSDGSGRVAALLPCPSTPRSIDSHGKAQTRSSSGGTHPRGSHRGCLWPRGTGHWLVLLSGR